MAYQNKLDKDMIVLILFSFKSTIKYIYKFVTKTGNDGKL